MTEPSQAMRKLMNMIARTQESELDCGEVFELMDAYCEAVAAGEQVSQHYALVMQHLEICSDCQEEFAALLRVLQAPEPPES